MRIGIPFLLLALLGCVHTYEVLPSGPSAQASRISSGSSILVGVPRDGRYGDQVYVGSGQMTTQAIVAAISAHARVVRGAHDVLSLEENLVVARNEKLQYLIYPRILHWEDRATEWSGIPDRILIRLDLAQVSTGAIVNSTTISGKSRWATFGGDHPQDLLPEPLRRWAELLFAP